MSWNQPIEYPSGKKGFVAEDSAIPQAAKDSGRYIKCADGRWHYNLYWFRPTKTQSICDEVAGTIQPPPSTVPKGFIDIYGVEPGPNSAKTAYRQARATFVDDQLPPGVTRADATDISEFVGPYGLPGARFFRLRRRETPVDKPEAVDNVYCRVVFVLEASMNGTVRYQDFDASQATDETQIDDLIAAWQSAVALMDPQAFPPFATISALLPPEERAILEAVQRGA